MIVVFGGVGSLIAIVMWSASSVQSPAGKVDEQQCAEEAYWARQREIADVMNKAAEDNTRAVGTGVFVDGSTVTARDPVEGVSVLRRR